jgi:limonene-1,2-epoxide hydrolase
MPSNIDVIRDFIGAWSRLDADELADYFTEDGCYHNMPTGPVTGRDNVRKFIKGFLGNWTATTWEIVNVVGAGDIVVAERVDRTRLGEKKIDLPCCGVFEMEHGKIKVWRDYFDLNTYVKAASA